MSSNLTPITVKINDQIFEQFPDAKVGVLLSKVVVDCPKKGAQAKFLSKLKQEVCAEAIERGIDTTNYENLGVIRSWRKVYQSFDLTGDEAATTENLLKRVVNELPKLHAGNKADLGKISNFVDLYNCVSIKTLTPMGALDAEKVKGDIVLRYGKEEESFFPLGSAESAAPVQVKAKHIVYADDESVLTWLWNYRDAKHSAVPDRTPDSQSHSYIILFADQAEDAGADVTDIKEKFGDVQKAMDTAADYLQTIGAEVLSIQYLSKDSNSCLLQFDQQAQGVS